MRIGQDSSLLSVEVSKVFLVTCNMKLTMCHATFGTISRSLPANGNFGGFTKDQLEDCRMRVAEFQFSISISAAPCHVIF